MVFIFIILIALSIASLVLAILAIIDGGKINNQTKLILGIIGIFIPVIGIVAYCIDLDKVKEFKKSSKKIIPKFIINFIN